MSTRTIRAEAGSIRRNSDFSVLRTNRAIALAISTPVGPAPTKTNVNRSRWWFGSSSASASSNACKILFRIATASARLFNPRIFLELVVAKVAVSCPCRQNQVIVGNRDSLPVSITDEHALLMFVHTDDFSQDHNSVLLVSEDPANWRPNLAGGQDRCRHLIKQWLKQVVVGAINQNDLRWSISECFSGRQPAKPSTDNNDVRSRHVFPSSVHNVTVLAEAVGSMTI